MVTRETHDHPDRPAYSADERIPATDRDDFEDECVVRLRDDVEVEREVRPREMSHTTVVAQPPSLWPSRIGGFVVGVLAVGLAAIGYLVVSDDDDDGSIDVPGVDVTVDLPGN